ncbi:MAG: septation protein SepH, partial [Mycetocola sp.]
ALDATDEQWTSWKDPEEGWRVKLTFTASGISNDARWAFDPKRHALTPINEQATLLSRPGGGPRTLVPRLRAVEPSADSEAFDPEAFVAEEPVAPPVQPRLPKAARAAINRDEHGTTDDHDQTADLLEALRRRRGERESAPQPVDDETTPPTLSAARAEHEPADKPAPAAPQSQGTTTRPRPAKKGRAALPSWDEIVFGAKPDDD